MTSLWIALSCWFLLVTTISCSNCILVYSPAMLRLDRQKVSPEFSNSVSYSSSSSYSYLLFDSGSGLFLNPTIIPTSVVSLIHEKAGSSIRSSGLSAALHAKEEKSTNKNLLFLSTSLHLDQKNESGEKTREHSKSKVEFEAKSWPRRVEENRDVANKCRKIGVWKYGALNMSKHLLAGAVAAVVSRTFIAPLERLKLEYIVRGERKKLVELIQTIAITQGIGGFWKGNLLNILRTAPFKAINFYAYDTFRVTLMKLAGTKETTNRERFVAGAAAGITATLLCLPIDTIRTKMVAPGGEAMGGIVAAFRHVVETEGFFSLYKGLGPSVISMAPSGAVFYGVYDMLKCAYLNSPEGRRRVERMREGGEVSAMERLELGPLRTLVYGAVAGVCAEATTYPFEVVRRQLQMQVRGTTMSALATSAKIVNEGGVRAMYVGLLPSLLQVLPSSAISYFVYEFTKIILRVE